LKSSSLVFVEVRANMVNLDLSLLLDCLVHLVDDTARAKSAGAAIPLGGSGNSVASADQVASSRSAKAAAVYPPVASIQLMS
jgi:superfamily II DNA/RNA helicase